MLRFVLLLCCVWRYAIAEDCDIVPRKDWDAIRPSKVMYLPIPVDLVIISHTVTPTCATDKACKSIVQNIQSYHMDKLTYPDIGASFLISSDGKVYEGAGWLHVGSHTFGYNKRSIGIFFIGNYNEVEPTAEALQAAKDLIQCGVENNFLRTDYKLVGQKQISATESPGRKLYDKIRRWKHWTQSVKKI